MSKKKNNLRFPTLSLSLIAATALILLTLYSCYLVYGYFELKTLNADWGKNGADIRAALGQLGDFYGGLLNPIIGITTIILVFITLWMQRVELSVAQKDSKAARKSASVQNFEQTFFSWLNTYRDIVHSFTIPEIEYGYTGEKTYIPHTGQNGLNYAWKYFYTKDRLVSTITEASDHDKSKFFEALRKLDAISELPELVNGNIPRSHAEEALSGISESFAEEITFNLVALWEEFYTRNEHQLDSMFRTLYRLIVWIDEQPETVLTPQEKWNYVSIVRAQLSIVEYKLLFFNSIGKVGEKFVTYINKYSLFDNLPVRNDIYMLVIKFKNHSLSHRYIDAAFSSDLGRGNNEK